MENISYTKITLAVFVGVTSSAIVIILFFFIGMVIAANQAEEDLKQLFSKPTTYPSQSFENRLQQRMDALRPQINRQDAKQQQENQIKREFQFYNSEICKKYYQAYMRKPTTDNLKVARQVCKNFG